ncbi:uncharacterized protein LOC126577126 [Anopheles aquasalis]|uniref:uncharacterized protein LOC126577126 n=1 Tax=Anopheles aquasalis TaxID=42839 RepID=UPI00215B53DF|nr:uncharacterized protein LOC126577126 [Anopheles aquasalis]
MEAQPCRDDAGSCVSADKCSVPTFQLRTDRCPPYLVCCPKATVNSKDIHIVPSTEHYRTTTERTVYPAEEIEEVASVISIDEVTSANSDLQRTTTEYTTAERRTSSYKPTIDDHTEGAVNRRPTESTNTVDNTAPWLAGIFWKESQWNVWHCCNGVLITQHAVLTTASCWDRCKHLVDQWRVKIGARNGHHEEFNVINNFMFRGIAILHLKSTKKCGSTIQPVHLPEQNELFHTDEISLQLFYWDAQHNLTTTTLKNVQKRPCDHVGNNVCEFSGYVSAKDHDRVCIPGSPVVATKFPNPYYILYGLIIDCSNYQHNPDALIVLTNVSYFRGWIDETKNRLGC